MKYCSNCGQQIKSNAQFCPFCGTQQVVVMANNSASASQSVTSQRASTGQQADQQQAQSNQSTQQGPTGQGQQQTASQSNVVNNMAQHFQNFQQQFQGNPNQQQPLSFIESCKYCVAHWNDFKTPESRKSIFWWLLLGLAVVSIVVLIPYYIVAMLSSGLASLLLLVFGVLMTIIEVSAISRRFIYLGKSPWLALLLLVPIAGFYVLYLLVIDKPQSASGMPRAPFQPQQPMQNYQPNVNQVPNSAAAMTNQSADSSQSQR